MTKRDVAVWFCQVIALLGMAGGIYDLLYFFRERAGLSFLSGQIFGLGFYALIWFGARWIGSVVAGEGEGGKPVLSPSELKPLLWGCGGLWILFMASHMVGQTLIQMISYLSALLASPSVRIPPFSLMWPNILIGILEGAVGIGMILVSRVRRLFGVVQPSSHSDPEQI